MSFVVLGGAGAIGRIVVRDLFESGRKHRIVIADRDAAAAELSASRYRSSRVSSAAADAAGGLPLEAVLRGSSVVINCTHHEFNLNVMEAALAARLHYVDLGGLFEWTRRQLRLNGRFAQAGLTAVLGMGCAPGLTNVMAREAAAKFERVDSVRIRVGGIDFKAKPGDFAFPYSAQTIIEELTLPAWKWSRGEFKKAPPRTGWEVVDFGEPVGKVWTVMTRHSEVATLPAYFRKRGIRYVDFKVGFDRSFVRQLMRRLRSGSLDATAASRAEPDDCEITRVIARSGRRTVTLDAMARANPKWHASAGDVDTACPASIVAQMVASSEIVMRGVFAPEDIVPAQPLFDGLRRRGIAITISDFGGNVY